MRRLVAVVVSTLVIVTAGCSSDGAPARGAPGTSSSAPAATTATASSPATSSSAGPSSSATEPASSGPCGWQPAPPASYDHVIWIWMENHRFDQVFGSEHAPYESQLMSGCGVATDYHDVGNPSLPNYIGATSGGVQGITDDAPPSSHPLTADNLFRQVRATGRQARSYQEGMPGTCSLASSGRYAVKHNPAAYYTGGDDRTACERDDIPLGTIDGGPFVDDLRNGTLPAFSFVTPDLCNDTHDCPVSAGDAFLSQWVDLIVNSTTYRDGRTAVFVVWDEDSPMPNLVIAPSTRPGTLVDQPVDHYALLRTTEELLGIDQLLGAAADAPSLRPLFAL